MTRLQPFECLSIALTNRCPLSCQHCAPSSGRSEPPGLDHATVLRAIEEAAAAGCRMINFTGGEPFAAGPVLERGIRAACQAGLLSRVTTGAFWATTLEQACARLRPLRLAGLDQVCISWSAGHAGEHRPINVINAVKAARAVSVRPYLALAVAPGDETLRRQLEQSLIDSGETVPEVFVTGLLRFGRGTGLPLQNPAGLREPSQLRQRCPSIGRFPMLQSDGTVTGCSVVFGRNCTPLQVGRLPGGSISDSLNHLSGSLLARLISSVGPHAVRALVASAGADSGLRRHYVNICDMCGDTLSNPEAVRSLEALGVIAVDH